MPGEASFRVEIDGAGHAFMCGDDETLLHAALRAGLGMPYDCGSGSCGTCRVQRVTGEFVAAWDAAPGLSERDRRRGDRMLACQTHPRSDATIRVVLDDACRPRFAIDRQPALLERVEPVTHDMTEFTLRTRGPARFVAGQYALLSLPGVDGGRAYSMSNLANEAGEWRFVIKRKRDGALTGALFDTARPGMSIGLAGPYGIAGLRHDAGRPVLCIAGGSGLSPMLSIAAAALGLDDVASVELFYGGRERRDLVDLTRYPSLAGSRLAYCPSLSDPAPADGWEGERGFVHEVARRRAARLDEAEVYVAGPAAMAHATVAMLGDAGVDRERIHFDSFL